MAEKKKIEKVEKIDKLALINTRLNNLANFTKSGAPVQSIEERLNMAFHDVWMLKEAIEILAKE